MPLFLPHFVAKSTERSSIGFHFFTNKFPLYIAEFHAMINFWYLVTYSYCSSQYVKHCSVFSFFCFRSSLSSFYCHHVTTVAMGYLRFVHFCVLPLLLESLSSDPSWVFISQGPDNSLGHSSSPFFHGETDLRRQHAFRPERENRSQSQPVVPTYTGLRGVVLSLSIRAI